MSDGQDLGPFWQKIISYGRGSDQALSAEDIRNILCGVDCVRHSREFILFIKRYYGNIIANPSTILSVMRACITIEDLKKIDLSYFNKQLASAYEDIVKNNAIARLDIDEALNFVRCYFDCGFCVKFLILLISTKIASPMEDSDLTDVRNIIINHRDVFDAIYKVEELKEFGHVLDSSVNQIFAELRSPDSPL